MDETENICVFTLCVAPVCVVFASVCVSACVRLCFAVRNFVYKKNLLFVCNIVLLTNFLGGLESVLFL
jgi:hypothetical protein